MKSQLPASTRLARAFTRATAFAGLCAGSLFAANGTWISTTGGNWSASGNWTGGIVADGTDAVATFSASGTQTVTLDADITAGSLAFSTGAYTLSPGGGVLTLATSTSAAPTIGGNATIGVSIAGTQGFTFASGNRTLRLSGANTYTGVTTLTNGNLTISSNSALGAAGAGNHTVVSQASGQYPQLHLVNLTTDEDIMLSMNWYNIANNGSVVGGNLLFNDSGTTTLNGSLTLNRAAGSNSNVVHVLGVQAAAGTLAINGAVSGSATGGQASGTYADPTRFQLRTTAANANINVGGVVSDGTLTTGGLSVYTADTSVGIVRFSGANTYTGGTVHQKGALLVNNSSGSGTGTGAVSVANTALFGGTGTIAPGGANGITFATGSIVAPGDQTSAGVAIANGETLTFDLGSTTGGVDFNDATLVFDLNTGLSTVAESLAFTGLNSGLEEILFDNNTVNFSVTGGILADGLYTLATFDAADAYTKNQWVIGTGLEAYDTKQLIFGANSIQLQIGAAPIPEPASLAALAGLAALGLGAAGRRRRR